MKFIILIRSCLLLTQTLQRVAAFPSAAIAALGNAPDVSQLISGMGPAPGRTDVSSYTAKKAPGLISIYSDSRSLGTRNAHAGVRLSNGEVVNPALQKRGRYDDPDSRPWSRLRPQAQPQQQQQQPRQWPQAQPQPGPSSHFKCPHTWKDIAYDKSIFTPPRRDQSLFYANAGSQFLVEETAKSGKYTVLINLLKRPYVSWALQNCNQQEFWRLASAAMAHTSSGEVAVMLPDTVFDEERCYFPSKPDGRPTVWKEIEYPALKRNQKVSKVIRFNGQETYGGRQRSEGKGLVLLDRKEMQYACQ